MARAAGSVTVRASGPRSVLSQTLAALAGAAVAFLLHPALGLPIAGAALAGLWLSGRRVVSAVTAAGAAALTTVLASQTLYTVGVPLVGVDVPRDAHYVFAGLMTVSFLLVGPVAAALLQRRPALETAVSLTALLFVAQLTALASLAAGVGLSVGAYVAGATTNLAVSAGVTGDIAEVLTTLWPGALVATTGLSALLTVAGVGRAGARQGRPVNRLPALSALDLDPRAVLLPIAAAALLAVGLMMGSGPVEQAGLNVLVVARWVFFLQGISVFAGLYEKAKVSRSLRIVGFLFLGVMEALAPLVSLTGLADVWLNIRRLPREGTAPDEPAAPSGVD